MLRIPRQRTVYTQGNEFISSQGSHALRLLEGVATPTRTCATGLYDATCQDVSATCLALVLTQLGQKLMSNVVEKDPYEFHYYATLVKVACGTKQGTPYSFLLCPGAVLESTDHVGIHRLVQRWPLRLSQERQTRQRCLCLL